MSEEKKIRIYQTHTEISPYKLGENRPFENRLSSYVEAEFSYNPIGFCVIDDKLYIPRGINPTILQTVFDSTPFVVRMPDEYDICQRVKMMKPPRDRIQRESIDFLNGEGEFTRTKGVSQLALVLDTGDGKTYTAINSIVYHKMKAIIITHQDKIKQQWIDTFLKMTNVDPRKLINIQGSEIIEEIISGKRKHEGYYYFVNHQTLSSFAKVHGWPMVREFFKKIQVGIKVIDEAHFFFKNVVMIDFFSNTKKTIYLTANFGRTDTNEGRLFNKCFASVAKFGERTKDYQEKRKHIIYVPVVYRSNPTYLQQTSVIKAYGFNALLFSNYALHEDKSETQLNELISTYELIKNMEGKVLITVPKIDDTEFLKKKIREYLPEDKTIATINSNNTRDENSLAKECDVIISTIKSCGTGVDIKKLRCIINLEPFGSQITANQLAGRLREYSPDKDTYFFDLIDISFPACERYFKQKIKMLKKKCKAISIKNDSSTKLYAAQTKV